MSWKILLSGYVAEYLYDEGQLEDMGLSFPELQRRAHVNARAKAADSAADFSRRIRDYSDVEPSEHANDRQWRSIFKALIPGLLSRAGVASA